MPCGSYRRIEALLRDDLDITAATSKADRASRLKWKAYEEAARRFNDFILNGKIPADLSGEASTACVSGN